MPGDRRLAIICPPYKLLFIMAPRTGCTALGRVLCEQLDGRYIPREDILNADGYYVAQRKHTTLHQLLAQKLLTSQEADSLLKFTAVRNPFDSIVSLYNKLRDEYQPILEDKTSYVYRAPGYADSMRFCRTHSFEEFIRSHYERRGIKAHLRRLLRRQRPSLYGAYADGLDIVMRQESLQEDFDRVLKQAGIATAIPIPRFNVTRKEPKHYREYYNDRTRRIVESAFAEDFKRWGYTF